MEKVLVSACLLGFKVRYDGADRALDDAIWDRWQREGRLVPHCPEVSGGLPTPRAPAEIAGDGGEAVLDGRARVVEASGRDVTDAFTRGAATAVSTALEHGLRVAVLTERSPSCASTNVHDGSFSGRLVPGAGVTAAALRRAGLRVFSEHELAAADALVRALELRG